MKLIICDTLRSYHPHTGIKGKALIFLIKNLPCIPSFTNQQLVLLSSLIIFLAVRGISSSLVDIASLLEAIASLLRDMSK